MNTKLLNVIDENINQTIDYRYFPKRHPVAYQDLVKITSFLSTDAKLQERIYCLRNDISVIPSCKTCNKELKFRHRDNKYPIYCCKKCSGAGNKEIRKATCMERYGVDNVSKLKSVRKKAVETTIERHGTVGFQSEKLRDKAKQTLIDTHGVSTVFKIKGMKEQIKQTMLANHGVDNPMKSPEIRQRAVDTLQRNHGVTNPLHSEAIKEKLRQTNQERYGGISPLHSEKVKEKLRQTNQERYGVDNPTQNPVILERLQNTNIERYGVKSTLSLDVVKEQIKQTNIERYGTEFPSQTEEVKRKVRETNLERYGVPYSTQSHIDPETINKLSDKEWLVNEYTNKKQPAELIASALQVNGKTVCDYLRRHEIPITYSYTSSIAEKEIVSFILHNYTGKIIENDRTIIAPQELDIVLPELKIAIEYCGLYWHSNLYKDSTYHLKKLEACNEAGYRLITIFEDEWLTNQQLIQDKILYMMKMYYGHIMYARDCALVEITTEQRRDFLTDYHIQGDHGSSINIGLTGRNSTSLCAVMSLKDMGNGVYDLNRFATSLSIAGGFSKLLTYFKRNYDWSEIYTFADRRWSEGDLYLKTGFEHVYNTRPNYFYIIDDERKSRIGFQKSKLSGKLKFFDPELSEFGNMENAGINRIYDCGNMKFVMKKP